MEAREALEALNTARIQFKGTFEDHVKLQHAVEILRQMVELGEKPEEVKTVEPEVM